MKLADSVAPPQVSFSDLPWRPSRSPSCRQRPTSGAALLEHGVDWHAGSSLGSSPLLRSMTESFPSRPPSAYVPAPDLRSTLLTLAPGLPHVRFFRKALRS